MCKVYYAPINNCGGYAHGVAVSGKYAYLANDRDGLRIYDISAPSNPIHVGHLTNDSNVFQAMSQDVAVSGQYAFLANMSDGLRIHDVSNPGNPINVGHENVGLWVLSINVSGNYALVSYYGSWRGSSGMRIYDVSNPATPVITADGLVDTGTAYDVAVTGNIAYLTGDNPVLSVWDISDSTSPTRLGQTGTNSNICPFCGNNATGISVSGNYIYLAFGSEGLAIYLLVPVPSINILSSNSVLVSWPLPLINNFVLQRNPNLTTTNWLDITNTPVVLNNRNQVVLPIVEASAFFRLKLQ